VSDSSAVIAKRIYFQTYGLMTGSRKKSGEEPTASRLCQGDELAIVDGGGLPKREGGKGARNGGKDLKSVQR